MTFERCFIRCGLKCLFFCIINLLFVLLKQLDLRMGWLWFLIGKVIRQLYFYHFLDHFLSPSFPLFLPLSNNTCIQTSETLDFSHLFSFFSRLLKDIFIAIPLLPLLFSFDSLFNLDRCICLTFFFLF